MAEIEKQNTGRRAVLYARFSPRRNADECESCESQLDACRRAAAADELCVVREYQDDAVSGKRAANRPGLQAALSHCITERCTLVVYSLSRLARNTRETLEIVEQLNRYGCALLSKKEKFDTSTSVGRLLLTILAAVAEMEREQIAERTADAMRYYQSQGRRMSSKLPYGWMPDPDDPARMVKSPREQIVIERIRQLRAEGKGLREIGRCLDEEGHRPRTYRRPDGTRYGGKWHHQTIKSVLEEL